jgi:hypothetical protein
MQVFMMGAKLSLHATAIVEKNKMRCLMKKIALFLFASFSFSAAFAHPQDNMSLEGLMHYYVKLVNEENVAAL